MATYRNGIGQIKRGERSRDYRRKHWLGAARLVKSCERPLESFKGRMGALLRRFFAV